MEEKIFHHNIYYFLEIVVVGLGFLVISYFKNFLYAQFAVLLFVLVAYILLGSVHHHVNHTFRAKIVIEYVVVALLVFSAFLFLNSGRL